MRKTINEYRRMDGEFHYPGGHDNSGLNTLHEAEREAERGSHALRKALYRSTHGFATRYGISVEEARHLLLNTGVRLPRESFLFGQAA